jgi:hypothetical protein
VPPRAPTPPPTGSRQFQGLEAQKTIPAKYGRINDEQLAARFFRFGFATAGIAPWSGCTKRIPAWPVSALNDEKSWFISVKVHC